MSGASARRRYPSGIGAVNLLFRSVGSLLVRKGKTALVFRKGVAAVTLRHYGGLIFGSLRVSFRHPTNSRVAFTHIRSSRIRIIMRHSAHCRVIGKQVDLFNRN